MTFFNPFGTRSIIAKFPCSNCDNPKVLSEEINVPTPNYSAENTSDSYNDNDGYAVCERCGKEYEITVWVSFSDGFIEVEDVSEDEIEIEEKVDPTEIEYYEQQFEDITDHFQFYDTFALSISNLRRLNAVDLGDEDLNMILKRQIYTGAVATMETFLFDTFTNLTLVKDEYLRRFIKSHPDFKQRKFELREIFDEFEKIKETAKKVIMDTIYHDLPKVRQMYHATFDIDFPALNEPLKCVLIRHDLVHRNGKTKDGNIVELNTEVVENTINIIEAFVNEIADKLDIKTLPEQPQVNLDDIFSE